MKSENVPPAPTTTNPFRSLDDVSVAVSSPVRSIVDSLERAQLEQLRRRRPVPPPTTSTSRRAEDPAADGPDDGAAAAARNDKAPSEASGTPPSATGRPELPTVAVAAYLELQDDEASFGNLTAEGDGVCADEDSPPRRPPAPRRRLRPSASASPVAKIRDAAPGASAVDAQPTVSDTWRRKLAATCSAPSPAAAAAASRPAAASVFGGLVASSNMASMASVVPSHLSLLSSTASLAASGAGSSSRPATRVDSNALSVISSSAGVSRRTVSDDGEELGGGGAGVAARRRGSCELWSPGKGGPTIVARNRSGLLKDNPYQDDVVLVRQRSQRVSDPEPEVYIPPENLVVSCRRSLARWRRRHDDVLAKFACAGLLGIANAYVISALWYHFRRGKTFGEIDACDGPGLLLLVMSVFYAVAFHVYVVARVVVPFVRRTTRHWKPCLERAWRIIDNEYTQAACDVLVLSAVVISFVAVAKDSMDRLRSGLGLCFFILFAFMISRRPGKIRWRFVLRGVVLQIVTAYLVLSVGGAFDLELLRCLLMDKAEALVGKADEGTAVAFGSLSSGIHVLNVQDPSTDSERNASAIQASVLSRKLSAALPQMTVATEPVFAFKMISKVFFTSSFIEVLYFWAVIPWLIHRLLGPIYRRLFGISAVDAASVTANVLFNNNVIAATAVGKLVPFMTPSQLHLALAAGFATTSGSASYFLRTTSTVLGTKLPTAVQASVISVPAVITVSKLIFPETKRLHLHQDMECGGSLSRCRKPKNVLDAASTGSMEAVNVVLSVLACVICILGLLSFLSHVVAVCGTFIGVSEFSFDLMVAPLWVPFVWATGVAYDDVWQISKVFSRRAFGHDVSVYGELEKLSSQTVITERSYAIASHALHGLPTPVSFGMQLGCYFAMAKTRRREVGLVIGRACVSGSLASLVVAAVCGMLHQ